jgi:hypothetical protein
MAANLIPLDEATDRLQPYARRYVGVRPIDVGRIVGTEGRAGDFDREFHALKPGVRERRRRVAAAFPNGDFPPIVAYKLGDAYFVVDGHHRVAVARSRGMATVDAEVTELRARWQLSAQADPVELVHAEQERLFMTESGLVEVLRGTPVRFTRAVGYRQLLESIQVHGYHLMLDARRPLERGEIARHWYSCVYVPTAEALVDERLDGVCPDATVWDRFLWVTQELRELSVELGPRQQLEDVLRLSTRKIARRRRGVGRVRLRRT